MNFPYYRKYPNNRSFFMISTPTFFEELKITGRYFSLEEIETKTLPERNFLNDMLYDYQTFWLEINAQEYEEKKAYCLTRLIRVDI